ILNKRPLALIVPHAGYVYSGEIAAHAYQQIANAPHEISRIVLIGPSHRIYIQGLAAPSHDYFNTPVGELKIDTQTIASLTEFPQVEFNDLAHQQEHSLEVQLPFIYHLMRGVKLVPLVFGETTSSAITEIIEYLWREDTLIVVSSDLSHFHSYEEANAIDNKTTRFIKSLDYQSISSEMACGSTAVKGLLRFARQNGFHAELISQCNSGDTAGDKSRVVGYASYAIV
ncbi:MAG: AmmeMemoRadiSam system protein B, partial [Kangiellaceae bacterium]|nr:AmmeMemoRadiSam system protein B [Kangiellaceae bacterium]